MNFVMILKDKFCFSSFRITLLAAVLLTGFLGGAANYPATKKQPDSPPNILLVISDDQSWPHAGVYGAEELSTPAFDRIAREGVLFTHAFAAAPQCSPNRAAILTGRNIWQLEEAGTHASNFPKKFTVFPDLLEEAGYQIGYTGKGWSPGNWQYNGRPRNPAGPVYNSLRLQSKPIESVSSIDYTANFRKFLDSRDPDKPFFFWVGTKEPHRGYERGSGIKAGKNPENVEAPSFLPDVPEIRSDLLDYYLEIEWFDEQLGRILDLLEKRGELDHTLVVVTSDNGMPFPGAKANLYEYGTHVPLAARWPGKIPDGRVVHDLTSSIDLMPTFLEAAGVEIPPQVTGKSLWPVLNSGRQGYVDTTRNVVLTGRERHTHARPDNLGYPSRAIRTQDYLYIWNMKPDRWPVGIPKPQNRKELRDEGFASFGIGYVDVDPSPSKAWMVETHDKSEAGALFNHAFEKRPPEELYNIRKDPACLHNLAGESEYESVRKELRAMLENMLTAQKDPRIFGYDIFESYPRYIPMRNFRGFNKRGAYNFNY